MGSIIRLYRKLNLLSIDVAAASVLCCLFFAEALEVTADWISLSLLFITVWLVYATDHLGDAVNIQGTPVTKRHAFYKENFRVIVIACVPCAVTAAALLFFIRKEILLAGVVVGLFCALYLLLHTRLRCFKEAVAASLFSAGILVPLTLHAAEVIHHISLVVQFFTCALINLLVFSSFDIGSDRKHGAQSFPTVFGMGNTQAVVVALFVANSLCLALNGLHMASFLLWCNAAGHMILFSRRKFFCIGERFRLIGDALFLLPGLNLL
jgi:hypothetical protein